MYHPSVAQAGRGGGLPFMPKLAQVDGGAEGKGLEESMQPGLLLQQPDLMILVKGTNQKHATTMITSFYLGIKIFKIIVEFLYEVGCITSPFCVYIRI